MTELLERARTPRDPRAGGGESPGSSSCGAEDVGDTSGAERCGFRSRSSDLLGGRKDPRSRDVGRAASGLSRSLSAPTGDVRAAIEELTPEASRRSGRVATAGARALSLVALGRVSAAGRWGSSIRRWACSTSRWPQRPPAATADRVDRDAPYRAHAVVRQGRRMSPRATFRDSLRLSMGLDHDEGVAYAIEGLSAIAALEGDLDRAGVLAGAAETIRQRVTMFDYPAFVYHRLTSSGRHPMRRRRPGSRKRPSGATITRPQKSPTTRSARRRTASTAALGG